MKHSLQLKLSQSLTMTPQLQQAIRLLQLSTMELNSEIQDALESNMMLELEDDSQNQPPVQSNENPPQGEAAVEKEEEGLDAIEADGGTSDIPEDLPIDSNWDDIYDPGTAYSGEPHEHASVDSYHSAGQSLAGHLLWQLNMIPATEKDRAIAVAVIDALDDDGYLKTSPAELAEVLNQEADGDEPVEVDEVQAIIRLVQAMEPAGVAARDLQECLLLQLCQLPPETPWLAEAQELVREHFALLAAHDYAQLMRRMRLDRDQLAEVIAQVQKLNPRPANGVQDHETQYIIPDVYVRKVNNVWRIELNGEAVPQLRINNAYAGMIRRADNSEANTSLKTHLQEARWFIKSLQSRSETLLRVAMVIVDKQRAFLDYGAEAMKPMILHDVATELDMHESTISRVTTRKYMHTPRGIFELKYFFSSHVDTDQGGACSSTAIRALIKKLIEAEKPQKPLSDSKIAELLVDQGIRVARRTVAKYREGMQIAPSNERKRLS
ncbi:MAG: RNA polymerase factor sigma-54 [Gammaproteobacteria bacterium]|jgi:RNA polymerase sigma-54 factor|nr:MAG: RNA polymerase factor sigma-54 [Gammaproteobacteria bacterium]